MHTPLRTVLVSVLLAPLILAGNGLAQQFDSRAELRRAFEEAVACGDQGRVEQLIQAKGEQENDLFFLFGDYTRQWLEGPDRENAHGEQVGQQVLAIARAAEAVFHSDALLQLVGLAERFDAAQRKQWLEAQARFTQAHACQDLRQMIELLEGVDLQFSQLGWSFGVALSRLTFGGALCQLGQPQQALAYLEDSARLWVRLGCPVEECFAFKALGTCLLELDRKAEAQRAFERSIARATQTCESRLLWTLQVVGDAFYRVGHYADAATYFQKELDAAEALASHEAAARSSVWLAYCSFQEGRDADGLRRSREIFRRFPSGLRAEFESKLAAGDQAGLAELDRTWDMRELIYGYAQDLVAAEGPLDPGYQSALTRLRGVADALGQSRPCAGLRRGIESLTRFGAREKELWGEASGIHVRACSAFDRKDYRTALPGLARALELFTALGWTPGAALSAHMLGCCQERLGQFASAIDSLEQAARINEDLGDIPSQIHSLICLGRCRVAIGQYEAGIETLEQALYSRRKLRGPGSAWDQAFAEREIGFCYAALGQHEKSIAWLEKALPTWRSTGETVELANCLDHLALAYITAGRLEDARSALEQALAIQGRHQDKEGHGLTLDLLGDLLIQLDRPQEAASAHGEALALLEPLGNAVLTASALNGLGASHLALGETAQASELHRRALDLLDTVGQHRDAAWSLMNLAGCQLRLQRPADALESLEQCLERLDRVGRRTLPEDGRQAFLSQWAGVPATASAAVALLAQGGDCEAAERGLPLLDSFCGRALLEGLQERAEGLLGKFDPALALEREQMLDRMEELRLALAQAQLPASQVQSLRQQLLAAEQELGEIDRRARAASPILQQLFSPPRASLALLQTVLRPEDALLWFVLGREASFVWVVTRSGAIVRELAGEETIRRSYERLIAALEPLGPRDQSFVEPARELYRLLLEGSADLTRDCANLIIIPDGFLGFLPFEVLLGADVRHEAAHELARLPYLIQDKSVCYAPSASFLIWSSQRPTLAAGSGRKMLLLGDPVYSLEGEPAPAVAMRSIEALRPDRVVRLLKTRDEVQSIARSLLTPAEDGLAHELGDLPRSAGLHGTRFDLFVGQEANKARLQQDLSQYRILHLAVHGYVDSEWPWFSGLVLSGPSGPACAFLNLVEIAALQLDAELVFLSACDTARGPVARAEGIKNTARSFLLAGARAVLATQWTVHDEVSAILAQGFYRELFAGAGAAESLRRAKIAILRSAASIPSGAARSIGTVEAEAPTLQLAHPAFWAPFVIWGR